MENIKKLIITGGVGVGKSTTIEHLKKILDKNNINYIDIPEYITGDGETGQYMFNKYMNKEISAFDFQWYIANYFDRKLASIDISNNPLLIFERSPDDTISCFANRQNKEGLLTDSELWRSFSYVSEINKKYYLPSYLSDSGDLFIHSMFNTNNTEEVAKQIFTQIQTFLSDNSDKSSYFIGLYNTDKECLNRIRKRDRESEDKYNLATVQDFNTHYTNLYQFFMKGYNIRFCDMGKLLDK